MVGPDNRWYLNPIWHRQRGIHGQPRQIQRHLIPAWRFTPRLGGCLQPDRRWIRKRRDSPEACYHPAGDHFRQAFAIQGLIYPRLHNSILSRLRHIPNRRFTGPLIWRLYMSLKRFLKSAGVSQPGEELCKTGCCRMADPQKNRLYQERLNRYQAYIQAINEVN